jgi:hypothetical protein
MNAVRAADLSARLVVVLAALLLIWFGRPAGALDCKSLPPGPEKKQCLMENRPAAFEKKQARCEALAQQRDSDSTRGHSKMDFMQSCMQGKVSQ